MVRMRIYLAGPLFTPAEREHLDRLADDLEARGFECFVPHRQTLEKLDADTVFRVDGAGLRSSRAMLAWLDGPAVDDGTACEIGMFAEMVASRPHDHLGIVGLLTDWRGWRVRDGGTDTAGVNLFVAGGIRSVGEICFDLDEAVAALRRLETPRPGDRASR